MRKKIAFLTITDAHNRRSWSGTYHYMARALERQCGEVAYLGPMRTGTEWLGKLIDRLTRTILNKSYDYKRSRWYARQLAAKARNRLQQDSFDYVVAPAAATAIAYLEEVSIPVVFVSDTTFALINNYYQGFSKYLPVSIRDGNVLAKRAMERAELVLFPSAWAADSAKTDYAIDPAKVHVLPFGANMDAIPAADIALNRKRSGKCRMLLLGVDWMRKGGDIAFETLLALEKDHGIVAELTVCGCYPPEGIRHDRMKLVGFLDKEKPEQAERLRQLFLETDYLLVPTRSECYGVVFCEASAYGVPSISTDTGGVSGVVTDGRNGYLLPEVARGNEYADLIAGLESDDARYQALCVSSRSEYDSRLNWDIWAKRLRSLMDVVERPV